MKPMVMAYLTSVLIPSRGNQMSMRNTGELKTLATALDLLISGKVPEATDILSQRFQAVEMADNEGSWATARHLELLPEAKVSSVTAESRRRALKLEKAEIKLKQGSLPAKPPG